MSHIVGTKIRSLREELDLTQEELAGSVGLSSEFISLLELGKRDPSLESLSSLARFFKKDLSFFLAEVAFLCQGEKIQLIDDVMLFGKNPDSHPVYLF